MPSEGLFDTEQFSLLTAPSSSTLSIPSPRPNSAVARSAHVEYCHLSPARRDNASQVLRPSGYEVDMGSLYSESAPEREFFPCYAYRVTFANHIQCPQWKNV